MKTRCFISSALILALWLAIAAEAARAAETYTREQDIIYGRKYGTALTMDVFTPKADANGAAVLFMVSGISFPLDIIST